ncbi:hypothetical protein FP828_00830, partial [bacterium]|nr:hypothetical protein [bacterium]
TAVGASVPLFLTSTSGSSLTNVNIENLRTGTFVLRTGATTEAGFGSLREVITPTGDVALGGTITSDTTFAGASMVIKSGNVGIGTTAPSAALQVVGAINATSLGTTPLSTSGNLQVTGAGPHYISSGNVGIGTTNPLETLHVTYSSGSGDMRVGGNDAYTGLQLKYDISGTTIATIANRYTNAASRIDFAFTSTPGAGSGAVMSLKASGNVGIGTTNPGTMLHVGSDAVSGFGATAKGLAVAPGVATARVVIDGDSQADIIFGDQGAGADVKRMQLATNDGYTIFNSLTDVFGIKTANILVLKHEDGNVGIGTVSPSAELDVDGAAYFGTFTSGENSRTRMDNIGGSRILQYSSAGAITNQFHAVGVSYINGGNLGIGTTTPGAKLEVLGASETTGTIRINGGKASVIAVGEINSALEFSQRDASVVGGVAGKIASISEYSNGAYAGLGFFTAQQSRTPELQEAMRIDYSGNVGIGTTAPGAKLHVASNTVNDTPMGDIILSRYWASSTDTRASSLFHYRNTTPGNDMLVFGVSGDLNNATYDYRVPNQIAMAKMVIQSGGNVGIGTTGPSQKLHVEGQCVTGDTVLPIIRNCINSNILEHNMQYDAELDSQVPNFYITPQNVNIRDLFDVKVETWNTHVNVGNGFKPFPTPSLQYIPIVDVKPGDYVLSLNEETQKIEPHRINGLLDMGVKPVFKLTTASGRYIKTTGNHPYLTKSGWKKIIELSVGDEIAVPRLDSMKSIAAFLDNSDASKELFFGNPAEKIFDNSGDFADTQKIGPEKDDSAIRSSRVAQDISEVGIAGNKYKGFSFYKFVDFLVRGAGFDIADIQDFMAGFLEDFSNRTGAVCVNENFHGLHGRLDNQFLFVSQKSGIQHASIDIFCSNWAEFIFNLLKIHSGSQRFEYNMDGDTSAFNAGFSMLDFRVYADMFVNHFFMEHFSSSFTVLSKAYHILENLSSMAYADTALIPEFSTLPACQANNVRSNNILRASEHSERVEKSD